MRPNFPSVVALSWFLAASAAGAQLALRPHIAVGATLGKGSIPSREETYIIRGPMGELGLELEMARGNSLGIGGFGSADMQMFPIEGPTAGDVIRIDGRLPPTQYANTRGFYVRWTWSERPHRRAAGFTSDVALSYLRLTDSEGYDSFDAKTAGISGGVSYSTRTFLHVAPTIGTRGYLHETSDGRVFRALTFTMTLESR